MQTYTANNVHPEDLRRSYSSIVVGLAFTRVILFMESTSFLLVWAVLGVREGILHGSYRLLQNEFLFLIELGHQTSEARNEGSVSLKG